MKDDDKKGPCFGSFSSRRMKGKCLDCLIRYSCREETAKHGKLSMKYKQTINR